MRLVRRGGLAPPKWAPDPFALPTWRLARSVSLQVESQLARVALTGRAVGAPGAESHVARRGGCGKGKRVCVCWADGGRALCVGTVALPPAVSRQPVEHAQGGFARLATHQGRCRAPERASLPGTSAAGRAVAISSRLGTCGRAEGRSGAASPRAARPQSGTWPDTSAMSTPVSCTRTVVTCPTVCTRVGHPSAPQEEAKVCGAAVCGPPRDQPRRQRKRHGHHPGLLMPKRDLQRPRPGRVAVLPASGLGPGDVAGGGRGWRIRASCFARGAMGRHPISGAATFMAALAMVASVLHAPTHEAVRFACWWMAAQAAGSPHSPALGVLDSRFGPAQAGV
jgi:hypothetical protein